MSTKILIIGVHTYNSGKTHVAAQIVDYLNQSDVTAEYFKPISAHNFWHNYTHSRSCLDSGILYSKDAAYVREHYDSKLPIELANPVHRLYAPGLSERPLGSLPTTLAVAGMDSILVMQRLSHPENNKIESNVLLAKSLIESESVLLTEEESMKLIGDASVEEISSFSEAHAFEEAMLEGYIGDAFDRVEDIADVVVIEAFNDSVWPWEELTQVDTLIAVSPGQVFLFDPDKILKAVNLSKYSNSSIREVSFRQIADLIKPFKKVRTYPNRGLEIDDIKLLIQK